jgi:hypothetical protein
VIAIESDADRLIDVMLHVGAAPTDADIDAIVASIRKTADAVSRSPTKFGTVLILVDTDHGPDAKQRKRIAEASRAVPRSHEALVTRSTAIRAIMTAIRWLAPGDKKRVQTSHATYEDARAHLVKTTGHPASAFDALHARALGRVGAKR